MNKIKLLNLHAGIGGNRKGFINHNNIEVTAVELDPEIAKIYKEFYPNDNIIIGDAKEYLLNNYKKYDIIWVSPPCVSHSRIRAMASKRGDYLPIFPDLELYQFIIFLKEFCKNKFWIVENVIPYYEPLIKPKGKLGRHLIWSNFDFEEIPIIELDKIKHNKVSSTSIKYGIDISKFKLKKRKDQIIRNCVNPQIGEHLLETILKNKK